MTMLVAQSAQLQSRLSAKGAVRESRKLEPKSSLGWVNPFTATGDGHLPLPPLVG